MNKKSKIILTVIISIVIIIIGIIIISIKNLNNKDNNLKDSNNISQDKPSNIESTDEEETLIKKLKSVSEAERIRTYLGKYFKYIENKDYEGAYKLLYPEFKQNYFPNIEDYQTYLEQQELPDMLAIEYNSITRQGEYYIVLITINDFLPETSFVQKEKQFVIKENNYNDYFLSFKK